MKAQQRGSSTLIVMRFYTYPEFIPCGALVSIEFAIGRQEEIAMAYHTVDPVERELPFASTSDYLYVLLSGEHHACLKRSMRFVYLPSFAM